ncbi:HofO family protein [Erwinia psidii]|uniref:DNA utilization protein HofO C-terminal domain-containing protein n=1 Tax=Erwinia psidii TaxID=69224 RepID=A0A3N6S9A6_9GAMM|nr:hypothetical protein [Erwinia psidii]MCX8958873.1 hypothetical protein [Erwinia psidii]MCX8961945.1 hypothetical protein [Erwinia psidii]MCX8966210.1 hypothetical protein [Erwinia psidii]RQM37800.1 hypothetical protein EB241_13155 [Erwinia psidii]
MSHNWLTGWLYLPLWWRVLTLLLGSLLLACALWWCGLRPMLHQAEVLNRMLWQQSAHNRLTQRALLRQPPPPLLEADITRLENALLPAKYGGGSLAALIAHSGGTMETWQPDNQGGELTVRMGWRGFLAVLAYLRGLSPGIVLSGFSLSEQEGLLLVRLSMVLNDDL